MSYSNGFDLAVVLPALKGRIGWQSQSSTVRKFESFHALCTEQNLRDVQPTENISDEAFTTYKDQLEDQIIQRCLSSVLSQPEYLEQVLLHKRVPGTQSETITNSDMFCGIRLMVVPDFGISTWIKTVTLLFNGAKTFNLYLYKDGQDEALQTIEVTTVANKPTVVSLSDVILSYAKEGVTTFYLGYYQADLGTTKAIREQVSYNKSNCFAGISMQATPTGADTFNQAQISYGYDTVGLNLEVHSFRDYTYKIKMMPSLFDEVIGLSMVYFLLELIVSTTRSNGTERALKGAYDAIELKHYLYGAVPATGVAKTTGLNEVLSQKFQEVRQSFYPKPKAQTVSLC
jgi:hypothetical protein